MARRAHRRERRAQPTRGPPLPGARRTDAHRHLEESHRSLHAICYYVTSRLLRAGVLGSGTFLTGEVRRPITRHFLQFRLEVLRPAGSRDLSFQFGELL